MNIAIKGTRIDLTRAIREYVEEKIGSLQKYFEKIALARIELESTAETKRDAKFRAEATLDTDRGVLRAEARAADLYAAIDMLVPKLNVQIEKIKNRDRTRIKRSRRAAKEGSI